MSRVEQQSAGSYERRLYDSYTSTHAGVHDGGAAALVYRRDIRRHLPGRGCRVLDIGCGQGDLVRVMLADGMDAHGVDISAEQVEVAHGRGLDRVRLGDFHTDLCDASGAWDAVVATDLLEHLTKADLLRTFDSVRHALRPDGVFVARVPNAVSPTGGHIMYGDITHQTWFTPRSVTQLGRAAGFAVIRVFPCTPLVHGLTSAVRAMVWRSFSAAWKIALAAETGQLRGHVVTQNLMFVARPG